MSTEPATIYQQLTAIYRGWNLLEQSGKYSPSYDIVDFDFAPSGQTLSFDSRRAVLSELDHFASLFQTQSGFDDRVAQNLEASRTFLRALLGERRPFHEYIHSLMGVAPAPIPNEHLAHIESDVRELLRGQGFEYSENGLQRYEAAFQLSSPQAIKKHVLASCSFWLGKLAKELGLTVTLDVEITFVVKDEPWSFGLSAGASGGISLEVNTHQRHIFTVGQCEYIPSHEIAGHAVQFMSWRNCIERGEAPEVLGLVSTHQPTIALSEGLAQALPYFLCSEAELSPSMLVAKKLREHRDAVLTNAQLMLLTGSRFECAWDYAISQLPFTSRFEIERDLAQRSLDPLQCAYLFCYSPLFLAFKGIASRLNAGQRREFLHSQYDTIPSAPAFWSRHLSV